MKIQSTSVEGVEYEVDPIKATCECMGFRSTGHCKHIEIAQNQVKGVYATQITFKAYSPFIRQLRTDKGWRVELEVSESDYDAIKELPKFQNVILDVTIKKEE